MPEPIPTQRFSPLHTVHVAAGASFTDFAGWQMPVLRAFDLFPHTHHVEAVGTLTKA